jgi:NhaP-type Na+/H+ or K+/H+ antiporter
VRIAAVAIALLRSGLSPRHTFFIGWFGPRGIGTLVLGLLVIDSGEIHNAGLITQTAAVTVTLSLVIHNLTAPLGIRLCSNGISTQTHAATRTDESLPPGLPHGRGENGRTNRP